MNPNPAEPPGGKPAVLDFATVVAIAETVAESMAARGAWTLGQRLSFPIDWQGGFYDEDTPGAAPGEQTGGAGSAAAARN